eukprot:862113_1
MVGRDSIESVEHQKHIMDHIQLWKKNQTFTAQEPKHSENHLALLPKEIENVKLTKSNPVLLNANSDIKGEFHPEGSTQIADSYRQRHALQLNENVDEQESF